MRSAIADDSLFIYLTNVAKQNKFNVGLILGQHCLGKDFIIHFAKTPPILNPEAEVAPKLLKSLADVNESWMSDHARHATRMLPGGMCVLGIFVVSKDDILNPLHAKIKTILLQIHKQLDSNKFLFGNWSTEKLVLHYNTTSQKYMCKSYDVNTANFSNAEFKFLPKVLKWVQFECKYEMNQSYSISQNELDWPIKDHMKLILDKVEKSLKHSFFLFDGENKDEDETVEDIGKKVKLPRTKKLSHEVLETDSQPVLVSIFENCNHVDTKSTSSLEVTESGGQIQVVGHVASKLWLNPKVSIACAKQCVMHDIIRSLTARLEMHWDSLTEEEHSENLNSVHEPPRRVLVSLPTNSIMLSDYLFPGEGPEDAQTSLEEMLDIKITDKNTIFDVEGQAETTDYYTDNLETDSEETLPSVQDTNRFMYLAGLGLALVVLILSLLIHFIRTYY
ncbi:unnamed protein product [Brassicogethes aeneus]|uniref:Protein odr-4 homolog n=1 Tax=Brassicogethes aeneus TaxID=1431903 RepID=A0A9P0B7N9_BRAAE|nr:unnamed protein product [Brassicogethes aeneus]